MTTIKALIGGGLLALIANGMIEVVSPQKTPEQLCDMKGSCVVIDTQQEAAQYEAH
jgi:hypothetical protein